MSDEFPSVCAVCSVAMEVVDLMEALRLPDPERAFDNVPAFYSCDFPGCDRPLCAAHAILKNEHSFCPEHGGGGALGIAWSAP
jgi:hypothetical protein